jgi:hypothetical protein
MCWMMQRQQWFEMARLTGIAGVMALLLAASAHQADARGGHAINGDFAGHGAHGAEFAGGRRHGNDNYIKAASDEREKLLTTKLKSICRGC